MSNTAINTKLHPYPKLYYLCIIFYLSLQPSKIPTGNLATAFSRKDLL